MSTADANDPHLRLAAVFIRRIFFECGHTWDGITPSSSEIAEFVAQQVDLMRAGKLEKRSLGGICFIRDPLTEIVEIGVSVTHHFPDASNMVTEATS